MEEGSKIVIGIKIKDGRELLFLREKKYYKPLEKITDIGHIENFYRFLDSMTGILLT